MYRYPSRVELPKESHPSTLARHNHDNYDIKNHNMDDSNINNPNLDSSDDESFDTENSDVDSPDNESPDYDSPVTDDSDFDDSDSDGFDGTHLVDFSSYSPTTLYARIHEFCEAEGIDIEDLDSRNYINDPESDEPDSDSSASETFSSIAQ
jgi:hypothetical protein